MSALLPLLGSHIMGDMVVNSHGLAVLKRDARFSRHVLGIAGHCLIHAGFAAFFLYLAGYPAVLGALLVFAAHFTIDFSRCNLEKHLYGPGRLLMSRTEIIKAVLGKREAPMPQGWKIWVGINFGDQGAHVTSLFLIAGFL